MILVVDASVAIKWFIDEPLREKALTLVDRPEELNAPDLFVTEVANAVWAKAIRDEITVEDATMILQSISQMNLTLHRSVPLIERALAIGFALNHPVYDCVYLACAEAIDGVLVTADNRLARKTKGSAFDGRVRHLNTMP